MRTTLLREPTQWQSQIALSAITANMDNDSHDDQKTEEQSTKKYGKKFFIHYTHEKRFETLKRNMHGAYEDIFQNTPAACTKMVVGTRNRRDTKSKLIRTCLKRRMLQSTITK